MAASVSAEVRTQTSASAISAMTAPSTTTSEHALLQVHMACMPKFVPQQRLSLDLPALIHLLSMPRFQEAEAQSG